MAHLLNSLMTYLFNPFWHLWTSIHTSQYTGIFSYNFLLQFGTYYFTFHICVDDWIPVTTKHIHFLKSNLSKINNTEKENNENSGKQPYR